MIEGHPPVVFIGPMGAGKTRLGKRVARILGRGFTDTDKVIVARHGSISDIFDTHGEVYFRALEREAVADALRSTDVVSLGGGAVLDADTRADLAGLPVVLLTVSAEAVQDRLEDGRRPLVRDGVTSWTRIFESRRPLYEALATHVIDTSGRKMDDVAEEVVAWLTRQ
jgi:shikimate kinase